METMVERCAGIDVGKTDIKVAVRVPGKRARSRHQEIRTFGTTTRELLACSDWLTGHGVTLVAMESTGEYWKPVFYVLEGDRECWLVNPQHVKKVPGRKSDVSDAGWLAQLVEAGLVRASFVPPPPIRRLRDLTRYRAALVHERSREAQRLHKVLQDAGIKLSSVATDILGVSGRAMIAALIAGERDPRRLAELAKTRLRGKIPELQDALLGRFDDHHAALCRIMLDRIDRLDTDIAGLDRLITEEIAPFRGAVTRLCTIPGVGQRVAEVIIAETGGDMSRFPTPAQLASWAGVCPGNNESAGRHFSGRTRHGNPHLGAALGEAAMSASHAKGSYLRERYRRIARRRGNRRALVAVEHTMLTAIWHVLHNRTDYHDLGPDHLLTRTRNPEQRARTLLQQLRALGYQVTIDHAA